jgi:hypothetical protein
VGGHRLSSALRKIQTLPEKQNKKGMGCSSSGEHLPCKHEALKSNPNIAKKERGMLKLKLK